ncbi:MAG: hypothetical protein J6L91_05860 [Clostridia bacterium]|nr:hypothetical protein [Clostridia bacterium]
MKMFKRVISLLLVSCLLFCAVPSAFAAESADSSVTEEEDILDNPIFSGAIADIVASFIQAFTEVFQRYVEIIKTLLASLELPEITLPELPEVPGAGDEDVPSEEQPAA